MDPTRSDNAFANYSLAYIAYCDGSSYTGNRSDPVVYQNQTMYFRGRLVLDALLRDIVKTAGQVQNVVVSGSSAGGLTVYLHLDHVATYFPNTNVVGMVDAGYFLNANTTQGVPSYEQSCLAGLKLWGTDRTSFDESCQAAKSGKDLGD